MAKEASVVCIETLHTVPHTLPFWEVVAQNSDELPKKCHVFLVEAKKAPGSLSLNFSAEKIQTNTP